MKKILASLFLAAFLISGVVGCGGTPTTKAAATDDGGADKDKDKDGDKKDME